MYILVLQSPWSAVGLRTNLLLMSNSANGKQIKTFVALNSPVLTNHKTFRIMPKRSADRKFGGLHQTRDLGSITFLLIFVTYNNRINKP